MAAPLPGAAVSVAVIGSLVSSLYTNDVEGSLGGLPAQAQAGAEDSVGASTAIRRLGTRLSSETEEKMIPSTCLRSIASSTCSRHRPR